MRVAKVDVEIGGQCQVLVIGKLFAAVPGQRLAKLSRQMLDLCGQRSHDSLRFFPAHLHEHDIARAPLHQRRDEAVLRAGDQVTFPVAGNGAVFDSGRAFPDRDRILDLTEPIPLQASMARPADGTCRAQMCKQLLLQNATGLDKQASVDRFVRHTLALVVGMLALQPTRDLLRRPLAFELLSYCVTERRPLRQLAGLRTPCTLPGCLIGLGGPVMLTPPVAPHLPADRRWRSAQLTRNCTNGQLGSKPA
ncbi:hypothetical protein RUA4292_02003 [Ruegeria atlantica]|uniref:Uncharacterized protein n=1 Tax=Ruegeria atlantica TaxID=81569 RepID=A0A0P1F0D8_9RHOB|nr:hypothetical protein RUA4292_02003 [Ruegeria atlantica]